MGTENVIKQVQKNQGGWSPKWDASNLPHNPPVAFRQLVHTPWARQSAAYASRLWQSVSGILALQWSLTQVLKKASGGMSLWHSAKTL